jgi:hypothetical protein
MRAYLFAAAFGVVVGGLLMALQGESVLLGALFGVPAVVALEAARQWGERRAPGASRDVRWRAGNHGSDLLRASVLAVGGLGICLWGVLGRDGESIGVGLFVGVLGLLVLRYHHRRLTAIETEHRGGATRRVDEERS